MLGCSVDGVRNDRVKQVVLLQTILAFLGIPKYALESKIIS